MVKSTLVYLTQQQLLPMERTVQLFEDLYGIKLSAGTVQASIGQAAQRLAHLRRQYGAILTEGERDNPPSTQRPRRRGRIKQSPAVNLLIRLRQHAQDGLRFLADLRVPFDNNQAERDIRMPKLKQKISGCFRTVAGADSFAIIRSYLATLRKQGRNVFHALTSVVQNQIPDPLAT